MMSTRSESTHTCEPPLRSLYRPRYGTLLFNNYVICYRYTAVSRKVVQLKSIRAYATIPKGMMGCDCVTVVSSSSRVFSAMEDGAMNTCLCVKRNKMDSELLTRLLKFIEYFPDYLSAYACSLFLDNLCRNSCIPRDHEVISCIVLVTKSVPHKLTVSDL